MTTQNYKRSALFAFILFSFLSLSLISCGGSTSPVDSGGGGDGGNGGGGGSSGISFDSGTISTGSSFTFTFDKTGSVNYICTIHPDMKGSVTVEDGASTDEVTVTIDNMSFNPDDITIGPGTKVTWVNQDDVTHTATSQ